MEQAKTDKALFRYYMLQHTKVVKLMRVTILIKFNKLVRRARNIIRLIQDLIALQFA
jgi:hypothetical protein